ncbi:nuclear transport factor 2 family protein [Amycolatopsis sp. H20-H5]|uniref:nuclear transport factor 2 family protein n=1 Tax=Amycolatopsis sp. H20-H5 TaxID=3046309 RepID=UPI002DB62C6A|nr:nuclear transport factor 2 family protein [Amycolatopsis sp. H20-H5]MEC3975737.1 nuclear transport factor 2 family protein [Amycolatopsis sp. H20-H5]
MPVTADATTREPGATDFGSEAATITQVILHERQGRDRGRWEQMADAYWPDSTVRLSWYEGDGAGFVAGSREMVERGRTTVHNMFAPVVHTRGDRAYAEASSAIRAHLEVEGVLGHLVSYSRLNYRLERRDGVWKITRLDAIYEDISLTPVAPGERINLPAARLAKFRQTYSIIAWDLGRNGMEVDDTLLGDDRPGPVQEFYDATWQWLTGSDDTGN